MTITAEERERERALFEAERQAAPHLFERPPMIDNEAFLRWIGIEGFGKDQAVGYLRLMPQDFIVEEIASHGTLSTVDIGPLFREAYGDGPTLYAELVKIGISTLEARSQLAGMLGIEEKHIGFAGIKDRLALTGQRISIRGIPDDTKFAALAAENFFLKYIHRGKGVIANGDLRGNRFTITLRTPENLPPAKIEEIKSKLNDIKANGFWNFFSFQRFGTPRLLSHWLGLLLIKGQYEEVVKTFLTYAAPRELPYFRSIRNGISNIWGNWQAIKERIDRFPYHFSLECQLIDYLLGHHDDFLGALRTMPDQIRLWFYAYDCFLFNRKLSRLIQEGEVPSVLPLITSFSPRDWEPYRNFLAADEVKLPSRSYRNFPFVRVESRTWLTLQSIEVHSVAIRQKMAVFTFSLPKGSYATTFLMNFFTLASGLPIVPGISTEKIDARELLNLGTLTPTLEKFRTVLERREQDITGVSAE